MIKMKQFICAFIGTHLEITIKLFQHTNFTLNLYCWNVCCYHLAAFSGTLPRWVVENANCGLWQVCVCVDAGAGGVGGGVGFGLVRQPDNLSSRPNNYWVILYGWKTSPGHVLTLTFKESEDSARRLRSQTKCFNLMYFSYKDGLISNSWCVLTRVLLGPMWKQCATVYLYLVAASWGHKLSLPGYFHTG